MAASVFPSKIIKQNISITTHPYVGAPSTIANRLGYTPYGATYSTDLQNNTPYGSTTCTDVPTDQFGNPVVNWITFKGGVFININTGSASFIEDDITITNCLVVPRVSKNIIKQKVPGRNGTVKTWVSNEDIEISIEATIHSNKQGVYPIDEIETLKSILDQPSTIQIESPYLNDIMGINYIVIENYEIPQIRGQYSQQKLYIRAISDNPNDDIFSPYSSVVFKNLT